MSAADRRKQRRQNVAFLNKGMQAPYPRPDLPHIAVAGRSNVGKSSLLNRLLGRKRLAGVGKAPGKTRTLWFFDVNDEFVLCDLPGYGYAQVPKAQRAAWSRAIEDYLRSEPGPRLVIVLVDGRHEPSPLDVQLVEYLQALAIPHQVVLTKADKVGRGQRQQAGAVARRALGTDAPPLWTSATTGEGVEGLWPAIDAALAAEPTEPST